MVTAGGSCIMTNGTISGNTANYGGGVYVFGGDTHKGMLDMSGGSIEGNGAGENGGSYEGSGGGVYIDGGTFTTTGGEIKTNNAKNGGGVYVDMNSTFKMHGGTIKNNTSNKGKGVYVAGGDTGKQDGDFIMGGKACVGDWGSDGTLKDGNDVYLARNNNSGSSARIKIDKGKPITESKVACITPRNYIPGETVVWMSDGSSVGAYTNKFTVTPEGTQTWPVDSDGTLKTP